MPNLYLAAKPQNWPIPHFLDDLCTAESMVATNGVGGDCGTALRSL